MRILLLATVTLCGLVGCTADFPKTISMDGIALARASAEPLRARSAVADLPDPGSLFRLDHSTSQDVGGTRWHAVQVSEQHALRAVADGRMELDLPGGRRLQLDYVRHVEHPDGNWSWIGRDASADASPAVLTFGEKAVFGVLPGTHGEALKLTTVGGRTWLVEEAATADAAGDGLPDAVPAPAPDLAALAEAEASVALDLPASLLATASTVDVVIGYTGGLATALGGRSQVLTRLNHVVAVANQAYADSQIDLTMVLAGAVQVDYPDATSNRSALFHLTGVECVGSSGGQLPDGGVSCITSRVPKGLMPLVGMRNTRGADLMVLMRRLVDPAVQSCGTAWKLGGGQTTITTADAPYGVSVVTDSSSGSVGGNSCRDDWLAHETGHNFGLQHDVQAAQGSDDTNNDGSLLDPEEYGAFPYSFSYSTDVDNGNFFTVMSVRRAGQTGFRVFSNPNITVCGGAPCGVAGQSDNALSMSQTMPVIAAFRTPQTLPPCSKGDCQ